MSRRQVIAVDFDHTLVDYTADGTAVPMPGAREAMEELRGNGAWLVIHTCRTTVGRENGTLADELDFIARALSAFGIPFDEIYEGDKMIADVYIDDRAVAFGGDWPEVSRAVKARKQVG